MMRRNREDGEREDEQDEEEEQQGASHKGLLQPYAANVRQRELSHEQDHQDVYSFPVALEPKHELQHQWCTPMLH